MFFLEHFYPLGDSGDMKAKEARISVRVDPALKARIDSVCQQTGVDEPTLVRNCVEALCDYVEETGSVTFPLKVAPKKSVASVGVLPATDRIALNEKPIRYKNPIK